MPWLDEDYYNSKKSRPRPNLRNQSSKARKRTVYPKNRSIQKISYSFTRWNSRKHY